METIKTTTMKIIITEEPSTASEAAGLLNLISSEILNGHTRGYYPHWHIEFETEQEAMTIRSEMNEWLSE